MSTVSWLGGAGLPASRTELVTRAPQLAVWALAAALGVQAAIIVTHLAGSGSGARTPGEAAAVRTPTHSQPNLTALANEHLFGTAPPPPPVDDANAPLSNAPLVLTGIIAAADPKNGLAIIGTGPTNGKVYPVGERLPGNARVHAVYADRVLIERNGSLEALTLPRKSTAGAARPGPGPSVMDRMQRVMSNEPGLLSDVLRPQPVMAEGKLQGYRVYPGRNAKAFAALGLRNGDLVLAINGTALDDPQRGNEIFSSLGNSDQAHVTVMRNGQQQDITLNMAQIASQAEQLSTDAASSAAASEPAPQPPPPDQVPGPAVGPRNH
jgi:general secretion pathway protein C